MSRDTRRCLHKSGAVARPAHRLHFRRAAGSPLRTGLAVDASRPWRPGALMSPQMNGEPREKALTMADFATSANRPATSVQADRPVLEAINTDGVQTMIKEDAKLAPLFTQDVAMDFRSRWDVVQRGFVDDTQAAVRAGDELVAQFIKSLAETFASQRSELEGGQHTEESTTENLRLSLRRYRSFFERLLSI
jgi:hypothetical protein